MEQTFFADRKPSVVNKSVGPPLIFLQPGLSQGSTSPVFRLTMFFLPGPGGILRNTWMSKSEDQGRADNS